MPSMGQATASTRACTALSGTEPWPASWRWTRESREVARSSPSRKILPRGTVAEKPSGDAGALPSPDTAELRSRYGSSTGVPFTVRRPPLSQQATLSPPTPTTRFTIGVAPQTSSVNTTTSPRRTSEPSIRSASTRSPGRTVGDMESVGIVYGW